MSGNTKKAPAAAPRRAAPLPSKNKIAALLTTINAPVAKTRVAKNAVPSFSNLSKNGNIRVRHREYIQDITGSLSFAIGASLPLNPGMSLSFPWLSAIANNYESYKFNMLRFKYETSCTTSDAGKVYLAIEYDSADEDPDTKVQIMAYKSAVSTALWNDVQLVSDTTDRRVLSGLKYVRSDFVSPSSTDLHTYDLGRIIVATTGGNGKTVGELYVEYEVDLITPQLNRSPNASKVTAASGVTKVLPWGAAPVWIGEAVKSVANSTISFDRLGQYLFEYEPTGTGLVDFTPTLTGGVYTNETWVPNAAGTQGVGVKSINITTLPANLVTDFTGSTTLTALVGRFSAYPYSFS